MDDAFRVRGRERVGDCRGDREQTIAGKPPLRDLPIERMSFHQLHREEVDAIRVLDGIDRDDVRVVEGGDGARFALEACQTFRIASQIGGQDLERDVASELHAGGAIHLAHAACPEGRADHVMTESGSRVEAHGCARSSLHKEMGRSHPRRLTPELTWVENANRGPPPRVLCVVGCERCQTARTTPVLPRSLGLFRLSRLSTQVN
jgi:hypothetical protein